MGMHVFFSGVGGAAIGPLAMIAKQAGYEVSGSDMNDNEYIAHLRQKGLTDIHIGQSTSQISKVHLKKPIDWFVYSSALPKTDPNHPELEFVRQHNIKATKRDDLINEILSQKNLKMIAVAGTHGKTTTTAMLIWLFKQLGKPLSYSVGAKIGFGEMGEYQSGSEYFIYEADEYDRNFLSFYPEISLITGLDWDHPDIYPTYESYLEAFNQFVEQSKRIVLWHDDVQKLGQKTTPRLTILDDRDTGLGSIQLKGLVNRRDGLLAVTAAEMILGQNEDIIRQINKFPGLSRRFEELAPGIYTDYAHTAPKIKGALQLAQEVAGDNVVVVYEGLHNTRQHFIKDELSKLFADVKKLYVVPSYLAREDKNLELLTPEKLLKLMNGQTRSKAAAVDLNEDMAKVIKHHADSGDIVICFSAGGAGSLDEWLRQRFFKAYEA